MVSEAQDNLGVPEVIFEEAPFFGAGSGSDAHEGPEDGFLNVSVGVHSGNVDWDLVARRRDRNGFFFFLRGGSVDGSSRGSRLRFSGVGAGTGGGLSFGAPPCR